MKDLNSPYSKTLYLVAIALGACGVFYLFYYFVLPALSEIFSFLLPIIAPFIIGGIIAALMEPVVKYLEVRFRMKRGLAAFLTLVTLLALLIAVIAFSISWVTVEVVKLSRELPTYFETVMDYFRDLIAQLKLYYSEFDIGPRLLEGISQSFSTLVTGLTDFTTGATNFIVGTATFLPNIFLILIISLLAAYFFSRDKQVIGSIVARILPSSIYEITHAMGEDMGKAIFGYIRAQCLLVLITAIQTVVGLFLLGIDYAITMGIVVGILDILPIVGSGFVYVPWMLFEFFRGNIPLGIGLGVVYGTILVVRQILEPKVVADNLGIHPLATLIAIYIGYKVLGILGLVVGPILLVVIKAASRANLFSRWI
ncbi:MAG: sporulation integral membrane protein YtvI [Bacillota bacterium]|jgi:sporulation integral membrane protein YtvI